MNIENNIFSFATKELSQDAVICWILNWINFPDSALYSLAVEMFTMLGVENFDLNQKVTIKQQVNKADIVVALHGQKIILVIEDKVYSSEHDDQIRQYVDYFNILDNQRQLNNNSAAPYVVKSIYFKTGYYYDNDLEVVADIKINGHQFLDLLSKDKYRNVSEILDEYTAHLSKVLDYYVVYGDYLGKKNERFYISTETIAQHNFLRKIFPKERWITDSGLYKVETGSSSGRPYAELVIFKNINFQEYDKSNCLFWRVDTNSDGPYLSLRLYDWYEKKDEKNKSIHNDLYEHCKGICSESFNELKGRIVLTWSEVQDGYNGNYYEASLFTVNLSEYLDEWALKGHQLIKDINELTDKIVYKLSKEK